MQKIKSFSGYDPLKVKPGTTVQITDIHRRDHWFSNSKDFFGKPATLLQRPKESKIALNWYSFRIRMHNDDPTLLPVVIIAGKFEPTVEKMPKKVRKLRLKKIDA